MLTSTTDSITDAPAPHRGLELLTINQREDADTVTLQLAGEVDVSSAPMLDLRLRDAEELAPRRIGLDLGDLAFIDIVGLNVLIAAQTRAASVGCELVVMNPSPATRRLFRLAGVTAQFRLG